MKELFTPFDSRHRGPHVFISYADGDSDIVLKYIKRLNDDQVRIVYDNNPNGAALNCPDEAAWVR